MMSDAGPLAVSPVRVTIATLISLRYPSAALSDIDHVFLLEAVVVIVLLVVVVV